MTYPAPSKNPSKAGSSLHNKSNSDLKHSNKSEPTHLNIRFSVLKFSRNSKFCNCTSAFEAESFILNINPDTKPPCLEIKFGTGLHFYRFRLPLFRTELLMFGGNRGLVVNFKGEVARDVRIELKNRLEHGKLNYRLLQNEVTSGSIGKAFKNNGLDSTFLSSGLAVFDQVHDKEFLQVLLQAAATLHTRVSQIGFCAKERDLMTKLRQLGVKGLDVPGWLNEIAAKSASASTAGLASMTGVKLTSLLPEELSKKHAALVSHLENLKTEAEDQYAHLRQIEVELLRRGGLGQLGGLELTGHKYGMPTKDQDLEDQAFHLQEDDIPITETDFSSDFGTS